MHLVLIDINTFVSKVSHFVCLLIAYDSFLVQKMPDSQLLFSWLDGYQKPHTSSTSNDPPVGDLLNLDSPMTATPLSNDMLLFGGETVTPTVESSNVVAIPVEALPVQQEQAAGIFTW